MYPSAPAASPGTPRLGDARRQQKHRCRRCFQLTAHVETCRPRQDRIEEHDGWLFQLPLRECSRALENVGQQLADLWITVDDDYLLQPMGRFRPGILQITP
jgi:hypothetical protein